MENEKNNYMNFYDYEKELIVLANLDESESYEVDYTLIGYDKKRGKFVLVTASGCSCWDGECHVEYFNTLAAMHQSLGVLGDDREFQPSLKGVERAMQEAMKNMGTWPLGIQEA